MIPSLVSSSKWHKREPGSSAVIYNGLLRAKPTTNDEKVTTKDEGSNQQILCMKKTELKRQVAAAIQACLDKKAEEISILEMGKGSGAFTDYFVLCSGTNPKQVQAIADEVELRLKTAGVRPTQVEGYKQADWILVDYVDFVVHVFSEKARQFYDLERLWKTAKRLEPSDLKSKPRAGAAAKTKASAHKRDVVGRRKAV